MAFSLDKSLICPVMVGQNHTLAKFSEVLNQAQAQLIPVEGEAGVGKSRLITEALLKLETSLSPDPQILKGRCFEPDRTRPYAPLVDLLRQYKLDSIGWDKVQPLNWQIFSHQLHYLNRLPKFQNWT
jgi:predicted ATPase